MHELHRVVFRLRGEVACALCQIRVVRDQHPSAAGRHDLVPVEAEARQATPVSEWPSAAQGAQGFRCVLDHRQSILLGDLLEGGQVTGMPENVYWQDRHDSRSEEQRLNSSHSQISYAVFCLKKKKNKSLIDANVVTHITYATTILNT